MADQEYQDSLSGDQVSQVLKVKSALPANDPRHAQIDKLLALNAQRVPKAATPTPGIMSDERMGGVVGPIASGINKVNQFIETPARAAEAGLEGLRQREFSAIAGSPLPQALKVPAYVATGGVSDTLKMGAGLVADPKNWPFLLSGAGAVRPSLKLATSAMFTALQGQGAVESFLNKDYQSAAVNAAFAILGAAGMPSEIKEAFHPHIAAEAAAAKAQTAEATTTPKNPATLEQKPVLIARHGQTANDVPGKEINSGWSPIPLDKTGITQAKTLADRIAKGKHPISEVVTSDLPRAKMTAEIVGERLGVPVRTDPRLRPAFDPTSQGAPPNEKLSEAWDSYKANPDEKMPGGETFNEFKQRLVQATAEAQHRADEGKYPLVLTHSKSFDALNPYFKGMEGKTPAPATVGIDTTQQAPKIEAKPEPTPIPQPEVKETPAGQLSGKAAVSRRKANAALPDVSRQLSYIEKELATVDPASQRRLDLEDQKDELIHQADQHSKWASPEAVDNYRKSRINDSYNRIMGAKPQAEKAPAPKPQDTTPEEIKEKISKQEAISAPPPEEKKATPVPTERVKSSDPRGEATALVAQSEKEKDPVMREKMIARAKTLLNIAEMRELTKKAKETPIPQPERPPTPKELQDERKATGTKVSLTLEDGTTIVGGIIHPDLVNRAKDAGLASEDALHAAKPGFTMPDGRTIDVDGKEISSKKIVRLDEESPKRPSEVYKEAQAKMEQSFKDLNITPTDEGEFFKKAQEEIAPGKDWKKVDRKTQAKIVKRATALKKEYMSTGEEEVPQLGALTPEDDLAIAERSVEEEPRTSTQDVPKGVSKSVVEMVGDAIIDRNLPFGMRMEVRRAALQKYAEFVKTEGPELALKHILTKIKEGGKAQVGEAQIDVGAAKLAKMRLEKGLSVTDDVQKNYERAVEKELIEPAKPYVKPSEGQKGALGEGKSGKEGTLGAKPKGFMFAKDSKQYRDARAQELLEEQKSNPEHAENTSKQIDKLVEFAKAKGAGSQSGAIRLDALLPNPRIVRSISDWWDAKKYSSKLTDIAHSVGREWNGWRYAEELKRHYDFKDDIARHGGTGGTSAQDLVTFTDAVETGNLATLPVADQAAATRLRDLFHAKMDHVWELGEQEGKAPFRSLYLNYFPHLFQDAAGAERTLSRMFVQRRPLAGAQGFLKHRHLDGLFSDAIREGLQPATYNPIEMGLARLSEIDKYIAAHEWKNQYKNMGLVQFFRPNADSRANIPDGWQKLNDRIFEGWYRTEGGELVKGGEYYAPGEVAKTINNYLSPGLRGNKAYDWFRKVGNSLNQAQLAQFGVVGFHAGFVSLTSSVSDLALGLEYIANRGEFRKGATEVARALAVPGILSSYHNLRMGYELKKAVLEPGSATPHLAELADAYTRAGGRFTIDPYYLNAATKSFNRAWAEHGGKWANLPYTAARHPFKLAGMALEKLSAPLMQTYVPLIKAGAFAKLAEYKLGKLAEEGITDRTQTNIALDEIADRMDDRFGQMVYDNQFWNKTAKDLALMAFRSFGWNFGDVRELFPHMRKGLPQPGGMAEAATWLPRTAASLAVRGKPAELSHRAAFALALPVVTGMVSAVWQYMATGSTPQSWTDYSFPQIGGQDPSGNPERGSVPGYLKDIVAFYKHPGQTALNKLHPIFNMVAEMYQNKDFYGTEIHHPDDPAMEQAKDAASFAAKQFLPLSIRNVQERRSSGASWPNAAASMMGFNPAPRYISQSPALQKAVELSSRHKESLRTREEYERQQRYGKLRNDYTSGRINDEQLGKMFDSGQITEAEYDRIYNEASLTPIQRSFGRLQPNEALEVWRLADANERSQLHEQMMAKEDQVYSTKTLNESDRQALLDKFDKALSQ